MIIYNRKILNRPVLDDIIFFLIYSNIFSRDNDTKKIYFLNISFVLININL